MSKELVAVPGITQLAQGRNPRGARRMAVMFPVAQYLDAHQGQDVLDADIATAQGLVLSSVQKVLSVFVREHPGVTRVRPRTYRYVPVKAEQAPPARKAAEPRPQWAYRKTGLTTASGEEIVAGRDNVAHVIRPVL